MRLRFSPAVFTVAFCCTYIGAFAFDWPLFRYYPMHGDISWGRQLVKGIGPAMTWYGLMANAGIVASLLSVGVPNRPIDALLRNYLWLFPCAAMLACVFLLRQFFV